MLGKKSSATVQQIQPFASSMISSTSHPSAAQSPNMAASMPMSPNSLTISAIRLPAALLIICRISVVLPDPKNPVITVAGIRRALIFHHTPVNCNLEQPRNTSVKVGQNGG